MIDLYDTQVRAIQDRIMPWLEEKKGTYTDVEDFRKEIVEKFEKIAHVEVDVKVFWTDEAGTYAFDLDIQRNLMRWDPDRQVHEVTHNVLDLPEDRDKGLIKTDKAMLDQLGASST